MKVVKTANRAFVDNPEYESDPCWVEYELVNSGDNRMEDRLVIKNDNFKILLSVNQTMKLKEFLKNKKG